MSFSNITKYLTENVAEPLRAHLAREYGKQGLKIEQEIRASLQWRPTIQVKINRFSILGIEVSDHLYPSILKIAAYDINSGFHDLPVHIAIACPLEVYQADGRQLITSQLRKNGIGLFTVDEAGQVVEQFASTAIMHHINPETIDQKIASLSSSLKLKVRSAYKVYKTNCYQGTQEIGQSVEAVILGLAKDCKRKGWITNFNSRSSISNIIDELYTSTHPNLVAIRSAVGGARSYIRYYRNLSSHPPTTAAQAGKLIAECRDGFLNGISALINLNTSISNLGLRVKLLTP